MKTSIADSMAALAHPWIHSPGELVMRRVFSGSRQAVFRGWTDPSVLAQWWGSHASINPLCEVDARLGGRFRLMTRHRDAGDSCVQGHISVLQEPELLELVLVGPLTPWLLQEARPHPAEGRGDTEECMTLTVTLQELSSQTLLNLSLRFFSPATLDQWVRLGLCEGWEESFDSLAALLSQTVSERSEK